MNLRVGTRLFEANQMDGFIVVQSNERHAVSLVCVMKAFIPIPSILQMRTSDPLEGSTATCDEVDLFKLEHPANPPVSRSKINRWAARRGMV